MASAHSVEFTIHCPHCGHTSRLTLASISPREAFAVACSGCGQGIGSLDKLVDGPDDATRRAQGNGNTGQNAVPKPNRDHHNSE